jgi:KipI family sensor histidine kinase inhibitor
MRTPESPALPAVSWIGDHHLLLTFAKDAPPEALWSIAHHLTRHPPLHVNSITPAECSILLTLDARALSAATHDPSTDIAQYINTLAHTASTSQQPEIHQQEINNQEIPVCYEPNYAPDLADVALICNIQPEDVPRLHAQAPHRVRFLGFMPGFAYIDGLPPSLSVPRLPAPRTRVPAGSVAIAGNRTGIYPFDVPGGWRIIGRTPLKMFDAQRTPAALLTPGDRVRFVPISAHRFAQLAEGAQ